MMALYILGGLVIVASVVLIIHSFITMLRKRKK